MYKEKILVSACFLEEGFKYNGKSNFNKRILDLKEKYELILACPEVLGGLSVPRSPSEIKNGLVYSIDGIDVTSFFLEGARKTLNICLSLGIKKAILKAKSPSCGKNVIYDGTFSHNIINGDGITVKLLKENGIKVYTELEIDLL